MAQDDETAPGRKAPSPKPTATAPATRRPAPCPAAVPEDDAGDDRTEPRAPQRPSAAPPRPPAARPVAPRGAPAQPPAARQVQPARAARGPAPQPGRNPGARPALPPDPDRTMGNGEFSPPIAPNRNNTVTGPSAAANPDGVQRSWGMTMGAVGGAVALGIGGMWLVGRGHPVFGVVLMAAIIPLTFTALFIRKAPCPSCKKSITVIGIDRCNHCGAYVRLENQQTVLCDDDFVAPLATFEAEVPLPIVQRLTWPEQGYCVCCGERAGSNDERLDIQGTIIEIPHCGDHQEGVTWSVGISQSAVAIIILKFRSFGYYRKFLEINEVHTRQGMWR